MYFQDNRLSTKAKRGGARSMVDNIELSLNFNEQRKLFLFIVAEKGTKKAETIYLKDDYGKAMQVFTEIEMYLRKLKEEHYQDRELNFNGFVSDLFITCPEIISSILKEVAANDYDLGIEHQLPPIADEDRDDLSDPEVDTAEFTDVDFSERRERRRA